MPPGFEPRQGVVPVLQALHRLGPPVSAHQKKRRKRKRIISYPLSYLIAAPTTSHYGAHARRTTICTHEHQKTKIFACKSGKKSNQAVDKTLIIILTSCLFPSLKLEGPWDRVACKTLSNNLCPDINFMTLILSTWIDIVQLITCS